MALSPPAAADHDEYDVLVFSKTAGFRHDSIPAGIAAIEALGAERHFGVTSTEDASVFTPETLAQYEAVIWLSTTGDVLNAEQQAAFENYVQAGGGYAGVHAASDTEYDWAWYGDLVGAYFENHPAIQEATVAVADQVHPSTEGLPLEWTRTDEWYNFATNPRGDVHILAGLQEDSYDPGDGAMGYDHPIAWCQVYDGGRSWYTGMGHTDASYTEPEFLDHLLGGIEYVAGAVQGDCGATIPSNYETTLLTSEVNEPVTLDLAPDGRVFYNSRGGQFRVYEPETQQAIEVENVPEVFSGLEDGLIGVALDPDFATNNVLYLHYSPVEYEGRRVSRFVVDDSGAGYTLTDEQILLEWYAQREVCCHTGGDMAWDSEGNLYIATGDNTNSMQSSGYTPIDERPGRFAFDAQRTSGNTNDLNGKILRIHPDPDAPGGYTIPEGNLFPESEYPDESLVRREVYIMGERNPYRIWVDPVTDWLYVGNVGPDSFGPDPNRGPASYDEWDVFTEAVNAGWPYCSGPNEPYNDYNFATNTSGPKFDCSDLVNDSPNNTGLVDIPDAHPADIWYRRGQQSQEFPWIPDGGGNTAMGGPVYRYDESVENETKFPEYYDGKWFVFEWARDFQRVLTMKHDEADPSGESVVYAEPFDPMNELVRPFDMEFGPDGAAYVLDYGTGYFSGSPEAGLYKIEYTGGQRSPVPQIAATPSSGQSPLEVTFSSEGTADPQGADLTYAWDFDGDGTTDSTEANPTYTYTEEGQYTARLTVANADGFDGTVTTTVTVGNTAPEITIEGPPEGGFYDFGDQLAYDINVTDPEDGEVDCARVEVSYVLGHDLHGHPQGSQPGCEGLLDTGEPGEGHGLSANVFGVIAATYTDEGGGTGTVPTDPGTAEPQTLTWVGVDIDYAEAPSTAEAGEAELVFTNEGSIEHNVSIPELGVDLDADPGETVRTTVTLEPGTYQYICDIPGHAGAGMLGELVVTEADGGGGGGGGNGADIPPLSAEETIIVQPKHRQAEHFGATGSIAGDTTAARIGAGGAEGSQRVGDIQHGEWISFEPVNFINIEAMEFRVSSGGDGGQIEVRVDAPDGPLVGSATVENTGSSDTYTTVSTPIEDPGGTHTMYLVFTNPEADGALFDVDAFTAIGKGISDNAQPSVEAAASQNVGAAPVDIEFTAEGTDPEDAELTYSWDFGDGATSTEQNPTHTYTGAGLFTATVTVTDPGGATGTDSVSIQLYAPAEDCLRQEGPFCVTDLSPYFNNDGIATEESPADGNFDGGGWSFAAEELPAAGPFESAGVPFEFPDGTNGVDNTVESRGQTIGLFAGNYGKLHILGSAHNGSPQTTATITYTDGSTQQVPINFTDWAQGPQYGEITAVATDYRYSQSGQVPPPVNVWHQTVALDPTKQAQFITLPDEDRTHIMGLTLDEGVLEPELALTPATGQPYIGDGYSLTANLATGGVGNAGVDVTFEVYREGEAGQFAFVERSTVATDDAGDAAFSYTSDSPAEDVVVACTGVTDCVDGDVLTMSDGAPQNLSGDAELVQTATVSWNDEFQLEEGYEWLFDGTEASLEGWSQAGPGSFVYENGVITSQGGLGLFWYDQQEFENFNLRLQFQTSKPTDNSGVFVRFPNPGDDPGVAINNGYEVQIYNGETGEPQKTGSIYNFDSITEVPEAVRPSGQWNDYQIEVVGQDITVTLNGEVINTYTGDGSRALQGFIGLQNHGGADVVSFRNIRIDELAATEPEPEPAGDVFDTVGITDFEYAGNGEIYGTSTRYSFAAELMPAENTVVTPEADDQDDVPVLIPDTTGTGPNLAGTNGQVYELAAENQQAYDTLHVFGSSTDAQGGLVTGTFTLEFADGSTEQVEVSQKDWGAPGTDSDELHVAIGPMEYRHNLNGVDNAPVPFFMYHAVVDVASDQPLVSVTFPTDITASGNVDLDIAEMYTMGLTFETADDEFVTADLTVEPGAEPEDTTAPTVEAALEGVTDEAGDYTGPVQLTLTAADEDGGSGLDTVEYRINGGEWAGYAAPFEVVPPGDYTVAFRATDLAGNVSEEGSVSFTIVEAPDPDETAPLTRAYLEGSFTGEFAPVNDGAAGISGTVELTTGAEGTQVSGEASGLEAGETYMSHLHVGTCAESGPHYQDDPDGEPFPPNELWLLDDESDLEGGMVASEAGVVTGTGSVPWAIGAEARSVKLHGPNGAIIACADLEATGPVMVRVAADDGEGSGVAMVEFAVDGGDWTEYTGPVTVEEPGEHTVAFRATDAAGNVSEEQSAVVVIAEDETPGEGSVEERIDAYLDQIEGYVAEGRLDRRIMWQIQAGVDRVLAYREAGRYDKVAYELRKQLRTLDQNRHLVPDDEVWEYLVDEGTAILEAMIAEGEDR